VTLTGGGISMADRLDFRAVVDPRLNGRTTERATEAAEARERAYEESLMEDLASEWVLPIGYALHLHPTRHQQERPRPMGWPRHRHKTGNRWSWILCTLTEGEHKVLKSPSPCWFQLVRCIATAGAAAPSACSLNVV